MLGVARSPFLLGAGSEREAVNRIGVARICVGSMLLITTGLARRLFGVPAEQDNGALRLVARFFGVRNVVLGAWALMARDPARASPPHVGGQEQQDVPIDQRRGRLVDEAVAVQAELVGRVDEPADQDRAHQRRAGPAQPEDRQRGPLTGPATPSSRPTERSDLPEATSRRPRPGARTQRPPTHRQGPHRRRFRESGDQWARSRLAGCWSWR